MHIALHLVFGEEQISDLFDVFVTAITCVLLWFALRAARSAGNVGMTRCLAPLVNGFVIWLINNGLNTLYRLLNTYQPEPLNTITDYVPDIGDVFVAVGTYRLWKMLQDVPVAAPTFPDYGPAEQGVWPPPPQKPAE